MSDGIVEVLSQQISPQLLTASHLSFDGSSSSVPNELVRLGQRFVHAVSDRDRVDSETVLELLESRMDLFEKWVENKVLVSCLTPLLLASKIKSAEGEEHSQTVIAQDRIALGLIEAFQKTKPKRVNSRDECRSEVIRRIVDCPLCSDLLTEIEWADYEVRTSSH